MGIARLPLATATLCIVLIDDAYHPDDVIDQIYSVIVL